MILTVTLNPAWDITHTVQRLEPGAIHRPTSVTVRPGGKGVNVSRVLHQLGHPTLATGLAVGTTGRRLRGDLSCSGIPEAFFTCGTTAEIRRTVTIVEADRGRATVLSEPGPAIGEVDWTALLRHLDSLIADAHVVVLSGSLPGGVPQDAYRILVEHAHTRGVPVIVDADAGALRAALAAQPDLVKPNTVELHAVTGHRDSITGGRQLLHAGVAKVVVSDGPGGLTGLDAHATWRAVPAPLRPVNPTGAGDAAVAALALALASSGFTWSALLRAAAAWSAAAVLEPCAGTVAADRIAALARTTTVTDLSDSPMLTAGAFSATAAAMPADTAGPPVGRSVPPC